MTTRVEDPLREDLRLRRERQRLRYEQDPEYRENAKRLANERYKNHKEKIKARWRDRLKSDPVFREKAHAADRKRQPTKPKMSRELYLKYLAQTKTRRAMDPEFAERERKKLRERWKTPKQKAWSFAYTLKKYGLTEESFKALLVKQGGGCAICGSADSRQKGMHANGRLVIDHDHATGIVRGLLCAPCNLTLGHSNDNPERLEKAAQYLRTSVTTNIVPITRQNG